MVTIMLNCAKNEVYDNQKAMHKISTTYLYYYLKITFPIYMCVFYDNKRVFDFAVLVVVLPLSLSPFPAFSGVL